MLTLETITHKSWVKCSCCSEQIRTGEEFSQVMRDGKPVRGERYCSHCEGEGYAHDNNPELDEYTQERDAEREREEYGGYLAAGCPSQYWEDQQY